MHKKAAIYLDVCTLGRPYDDQSFMRIQAETVAVNIIITAMKEEKFRLYYSPVHEQEIVRNKDETEKAEIKRLLHNYGTNIYKFAKESYLAIERRAFILETQGMGIIDAFHVAHAEKIGAAFISCDDRLVRKCEHLCAAIWCGGPIDFCRKERLL